jgi:bis(5'-nucleosyl)-tetraphosphatase (symmetrical)
MRLVVGDLHGCYQTLRRLLAHAGWSAGRDELWCVGDIVTKGTGSLEALRWLRQHAGSVRAVLGNHELHLLAVASGLRRPGRTDRLDEVLAAPDRGPLLDWLRSWPLLHQETGWLMVHAGLWPAWTGSEAARLAASAAEALRGPSAGRVLATAIRADLEARPAPSASRAWQDAPGLVAAILTQIRIVHPSGRLDLGFTGAPGAAPDGLRPWYELSAAPGDGLAVLFGHWARLGRWSGPWLCCLDSGCVYGGELSGLWLETGEAVSVPVSGHDLR